MTPDPAASLLIVDDHEINCRQLGSLLRQHGYSVVQTQNGKQALEWIGRQAFDLVLLDISLQESITAAWQQIEAWGDRTTISDDVSLLAIEIGNRLNQLHQLKAPVRECAAALA